MDPGWFSSPHERMVIQVAFRACRTHGPCACELAGEKQPCAPARRAGEDIANMFRRAAMTPMERAMEDIRAGVYTPRTPPLRLVKSDQEQT